MSQTDVDRFVFADERLFFKNKYPTGYSLGGGHYEAKLKSLMRPSEFYQRMADFCYAAITSWKVYHFHDTGDTARLKRTQLYMITNICVMTPAIWQHIYLCSGGITL